MKTLTKSEALVLQKNGSRFLVNGKEMTGQDLVRIPTPVKKPNLLARFCDILADGFSKLAASQDATTRVLFEKLAAPPPALPPPSAPAVAAEPVTWKFALTRDTSGRATHITATPGEGQVTYQFEVLRDSAGRVQSLTAKP